MGKSFEVFKKCPICDGKVKCSNGVRITTFYCKDKVCTYISLNTKDMSIISLSVSLDIRNDISKDTTRFAYIHHKTPSHEPISVAGIMNPDSGGIYGRNPNYMRTSKIIEPESFSKEDLIAFYNKLTRLSVFK